MSAASAACLDDDAIATLLAGALGDAERAALTEHIDRCDDCWTLVADAARTGAPPLGPGAPLGRYVILGTVGAGAMGVVLAAYDPELDRRVALKLLRRGAEGEGSPSGSTQRLLREAQSLARLAHPNVITIHDAGTIDGEVFIAMEFVDQGTLGDWLAARPPPRPWRVVLEMLRQAGEGLAAAHAAGIVHRDFKPDNVLVGSDGRVRVTDFGLARHEADAAPLGAGGPRLVEARADARLTQTGTLVGTPGYMAPECLAGAAGDARSDQYSFCVTLYEALYGERPFAGTDVTSLAEAIAQGRARRVPPGSTVPAWVRRLVLRGLSSDPARRFPTMRALLDALAKGVRARPRRAVALAALLLVAATLAAAGGLRARTPPLCAGAEVAWGDAWDPARAEAVRDAFLRSGRPSAAFALGQVTQALDAYRASWIARREDACAATRVRGEQSEALLDLRMRCLDDRRKEVCALGRVLAEADGGGVDRAISAVLSLPPLPECDNARALSSPIPLPASESRARIEALGDRLAEANALAYAGQHARGLEIVRPALEDARATGYTPILARLLLAEGRLTYGGNDLAASGPIFHEAAAVAMDAHEDLVAADAWTMLVRVRGTFERFEEGRLWARYAEAAIRRAGGDDQREAVRLRFLATSVWRRERKLDEARALIERARALFGQSRGARYDFDLASCDEGIAGIEFDMGRPERALPLHSRVAEVRERLFGSEHPSVAVALANLGEDLTKLGRAAEAVPLLERAVSNAAPRAEKGGDGYFRHKLAAALRGRGDVRAALEQDELAHASSVRAGEGNGYWESFSLTGLGLDLLALGRAPEAVAPLERAVALRAKNPIGFELGEARFALALALWETGETGPATGRARALAVAAEARDDLREDADRYGSWFATSRGAIDTWLAGHRLP